jgi:uncharacterized protein YlxP (DUF503 family)
VDSPCAASSRCPLLPFLPAPDERVWIGVLRVVLRIPGSRSLKDRRRVVAALRDRLQARHRVLLADVGHLEAHDAAVLALSCLGNDSRGVQSVLDQARSDLLSHAEAIVTDMQVDVTPWPVIP